MAFAIMIVHSTVWKVETKRLYVDFYPPSILTKGTGTAAKYSLLTNMENMVSIVLLVAHPSFTLIAQHLQIIPTCLLKQGCVCVL